MSDLTLITNNCVKAQSVSSSFQTAKRKVYKVENCISVRGQMVQTLCLRDHIVTLTHCRVVEFIQS